MSGGGTFSDYQVHLWLKPLSGYYVAAHFDNPIHAGAYASEISGDGYVRQQVFFTEPSNRTIWNITNFSFAGLPASVITHFVGWDAKTKGNWRWMLELPEPKRVIAGGGFSVVEGDLAVSFA